MKSSSKVNKEMPGSFHRYRTALGTTDYDIPMFGFKGALFIFVAIFFIGILIPSVTAMFVRDTRLINLVLCAPAMGFSISYAQTYLSRRFELGSQFVKVGLLLTLLSAIVLFFIYYAGVLA